MDLAVVILVVLTALMVAMGVALYFRNKGIEGIRADVYQLFLEIENNPDYARTGKKKMKWVLARARGLLPAWLQMFISDEFLEEIIEGWFVVVKDLLDDGKYNGSTEGMK